MCHIYIRPRSPNLNGKVERSHSTGELEFYQLLTYTDDVDLRKKLAEWEDFYNVHRVWSVKGAAYRQGISLRRPGDARGHVLGQPSTMSLAAQLRQAMATASDLRRTPPRLAGCVSLPGVRAPTDPGRTLRPVWFVPDQAPPEALSGEPRRPRGHRRPARRDPRDLRSRARSARSLTEGPSAAQTTSRHGGSVLTLSRPAERWTDTTLEREGPLGRYGLPSRCDCRGRVAPCATQPPTLRW